MFSTSDSDQRAVREDVAEAAQDADRVGGPAARARVVADYIAGMTDRYAISAHRRLSSRN